MICMEEERVQIQMHEQWLQMQQQLQQLQSGQPAGGDASMGGGGSLSTNHQHASTNLFVPLQPLGLIGSSSNSSSSSLAYAKQGQQQQIPPILVASRGTRLQAIGRMDALDITQHEFAITLLVTLSWTIVGNVVSKGTALQTYIGLV